LNSREVVNKPPLEVLRSENWILVCKDYPSRASGQANYGPNSYRDLRIYGY